MGRLTGTLSWRTTKFSAASTRQLHPWSHRHTRTFCTSHPAPFSVASHSLTRHHCTLLTSHALPSPHSFPHIPRRHTPSHTLRAAQTEAQDSTSTSTSTSTSPAPSPTSNPPIPPSPTPPSSTPQLPPPPRVDLRGLPILKLQPEILAAGGLDPSTQPPELLSQFDQTLRDDYLAVNLQYPGLRILNIVPPVLTIPEFLTKEECEKLMQGANDSGLMKTSGVSEHVGKVGASLRTSSTVAITSSVMKDQPLLSDGFSALLAKAAQLLPDVGRLMSESGDVFKVPNKPKQVALELPQVTRYETGQYFLHHYDAFPSDIARSKGYQRRATLLLYLNDVAEGGGTNFHSLGICTRPKQGTALLFFPSFSNGVSDPRTLHTAEEAVDIKWVSQTWISCGLDPPQVKASGAVQVQANGNEPKFAVPLPNPFKKKTGSKKKSKRK